MFLLDINTILYSVILLINIVLYAKGTLKTKERWFTKILIYLLTILFVHITSILFVYYYLNNIKVFHFFSFAQILIVSSFYKEVIDNPKIKRGINYSLLISFLIVGGQFIIIPETLNNFSILEVFLFNYLIIIYGLVYSFRNLALKPRHNIINIGLITYCLFTISILTYGNYLVKVSVDDAAKVWMLHDYNNLFFQLMILAQYVFYKRLGRGEIQ